MRANLLLVALLPLLSFAAEPQEAIIDDAVQINVPLRFETLGTETTDPQVGAAIVVSNLADADRQISTVLLRGIQTLGLLIESPKLDLTQFLTPDQEWRSNVFELDANWIREYNAYKGASALPAGRIYAVQYTGRYRYAPAILRIALSITLYERSRLGPLRKVSFTYSNRYFAARLEQAIQSQLTPPPQSK